MKHILVLDDEEVIRHMLAEILGSAGYRYTCVATLQEAMSVVRDDPPDLAITDMQLEEFDGFDFIERVAEEKPGTPVILLTGMLFDQQAITTKYAGRIAGYIQKTSPLSKIMAEVQRHLPGK